MGLLGGVIRLAGAAVKAATGIDLKDEVNGLANSADKSSEVKKEIKYLKENKEEYIKELGTEQYNELLDFYEGQKTQNSERTAEHFMDLYGGLKDGCADFNDRMEDRKEKLMESARALNDKQLIYLSKKNDLSEVKREVVEEEMKSRGL